MKRIFCVLLVFAFVFFVSCGTEDVISNNNHNQEENQSPPEIITVSYDELKEIKFAVENFDSDAFIHYMKENHGSIVLNGMYDLEIAKELLKELESTTILTLKDDFSFDDELSFYHERNEVQQLVSFNESSRISIYNYTPQSSRDKSGSFGENNEKAILLEELNFDGITISIYQTDSENTFFADVLVNGTYIFVRTKDIETVDDFKDYLSMIEFVKIGDLLNESNAETMPTEICTEETNQDEYTVFF